MFDKDFFKFALGFCAIIAASLCVLYFSGHFDGVAGTGTNTDKAPTSP